MVLKDRIALVTGAGRGIGRAIAVALAEAGAHVAVNDLTEPGETIEAIRAAGRMALAVPGDVSDQPTVAKLVADTVREFGRLDIAVANAYWSHREPFYEADLVKFRRTVDVTMWGAFHLLHAAAGQMIAQPPPPPLRKGGSEKGSIVLIGSPHAHVAVPRAMAYNMAKAAVDHMGRTAAIELAEHRIRVNIIHPGWIDTPGEREHASEEQIQKAAAKLPWGRLGKPEEIGRGVVFLCDPASDYITGSTLEIAGAITLPWWASRGSAVPE
jgi:glucose 1-dehydrogenase